VSDRRQFITLLGGAAAAWPLAARAQSMTKRRIGLLAAASPESAVPQTDAIYEGLRDLGYVEGRDYEMIQRWAYGVIARLPALAEELVAIKPDVIIAVPTPAIMAARAHTTTLPIVSFLIADEMRLGFVASHAKPGGNVTGLLMRVEGMVGKQIELAMQTVPTSTKIGVVYNPTSAEAPGQRVEAEAASSALGVTIQYGEVRSPLEVDSALRSLERGHVGVAVLLHDGLFFQERKRIANVAAILGIPIVYSYRDHVIDGGLISYGVSLRANARRMATYIDKIFKGAQPADLPLEFPTKLELVINLQAAKTLGLEIPPTLLARADEVIE
jgi:putative ABC transport system substrate-binding protein